VITIPAPMHATGDWPFCGPVKVQPPPAIFIGDEWQMEVVDGRGDQQYLMTGELQAYF